MTWASTTGRARRRSPSPAHGAKIVDRPADLADRDIVVIMVSADSDLEAVDQRRRRPADRRPATARAQDHRRFLHRLARVLGPHPRRRRGARRAVPGRPGQREPQGDRGGQADRGRLGTARGVRRGRAAAGRVRPRRHLRRRGRGRPAGQDRAQRVPRRRHPVPGRDHRAGRARRGLPGGVPRLPQRLGARLDVHPLQDAGPGQPGLPRDLHQRPAAQGPAAGAVGGQGAGRADAARGRRRHAGRAGHRGRVHRGRLRHPGARAGPPVRLRDRAGERAGR